MASSRYRMVGVLASGLSLAVGGAVLVLAWQAGLWATQVGALLCLAWLIGLGCWSASQRERSGGIAAAGEAEEEAAVLRGLLDQVPAPLIRVDSAGAHAINRAARSLFATDDRVLPTPPALTGDASARLVQEGRSWRVDAVDTAPGRRLAVLIDVEAEERAAEGRAADEMIEILGHELLNGLSPIVSLADSAVTAAAHRDALLPDILATLARRVESLEQFARSYRALSRLPDPVVRPVVLDDLLYDLSRLFRSRFGGDVVLSMEAPRDARVPMDRDQMTQALWALLQNGAEAALAGGAPRTLGLAVRPEPDMVSIRISDSGDGIAEADRARIFRPFYTTKPEGSGIGLSLAQRIVRGHGGDLRLLPSARTIFELRMPARSRT